MDEKSASLMLKRSSKPFSACSSPSSPSKHRDLFCKFEEIGEEKDEVVVFVVEVEIGFEKEEEEEEGEIKLLLMLLEIGEEEEKEGDGGVVFGIVVGLWLFLLFKNGVTN